MKRKRLTAVFMSTLLVLSSSGLASMAGTITSNGTSENAQTLSAHAQDIIDVDFVDDETIASSSDAERDTSKEYRSRAKESAKASPSDAIHVSNESELRQALQSDGTIILDEAIELNDNLLINNRNIELTGETISCGDQFKNNNMIVLENNSNVVFKDITIDATAMKSEGNQRLYTIYGYDGTSISIENGAAVLCDEQMTSFKVKRRGVFSSGQVEINGGAVAGFNDGGITILKGGTFTLNDGELRENGNYLSEAGFPSSGAAIQGDGNKFINGGLIYANEYGVYNQGYLGIKGGEISENVYGIFNENHDRKEPTLTYNPLVEIIGGNYFDNEKGTIINTEYGEVKLSGGDFSDSQALARSISSSVPIITNEKNAILTIEGDCSIITRSASGTAISNDKTGKLKMLGGSIIAEGNSSVAVRNENSTAGQVKLSGGVIQAQGTNTKALDNQNGGYTEANGTNIEETGKYLVSVSHNDGGTVSPSSEMVSDGQEINFVFSPANGYKISDVFVDGVSHGAISTLKLTVNEKHSIEVTFEEKSSSGGNSGGGGGSSSGSSRISSGTTQPAIPETPGTWKQDATGWKFMVTDTTAYINTWIYIGGHWYRTGIDGYMLQGWNTIDGKQYYLTPVSGELKTGWLSDNNFWFYLDSSGAMQTGWVQVNGKWYFLDSNGKMAVDTTTEDGYKLGADGAWMQ